MRHTLFAILASMLAIPGQAQLLSPPPEGSPSVEEDTPLVLREAANPAAPSETVEEAIERIRAEMREIAQSALSEYERREAYEELYRRNALVLRRESTERPPDNPETVEEAVDKIEMLIFEVALESAPDQAAREQVLANAPGHLVLETNRPDSEPEGRRAAPVFILRDPEAEGSWWGGARVDTEALALEEVPESPEEQLEPPEENIEEAEEEAPVAVEVLADEKTTVEMHDDATILREVTSDDGDLVLFDALHFWIGGAVQYDAYSYDDLLNARSGGGSEDSTSMRRGEVIVRSTLYDLGEIKWQYDLESNFWRDFYYRLADTERNFILTVGNQNEPISQESTLGNKFNSAMEIAAPTSTFGSYRGMGVALNNWFEKGEGDEFFGILTKSETAITTGFGIFGQDIEDTNDTDLAATGRVTWGRLREDGTGLHLGVSGTYRDGEFDRINPRPEIAEADRVVLAEFDADTAAVLGLEALYIKGSLHASSEFYFGAYRGGDSDGQGAGGFVEVGYYLTGQERSYRPQWGLWAPLQVGAQNIFEVFARVSYTYGDADNQASNDLSMFTLGGSWYRHKFRTSVNLLYGTTDRDVEGEDAGFGASMRVQYLF